MKPLYPSASTSAAASKDRLDKARHWLNSNGPIIIVVTVLLVCLAMFTLKSEFARATPKEVKLWYVDTVTGEYFQADGTLLPPIQSPFGNEAVRVFFYDCADCDDPQPKFRIFERYTEEAKRLSAQLLSGEMPDSADLDTDVDMWEVVYAGRQISFDGVNWVTCEDDMEAEEKLGERCAIGEVVGVPDPF